MLGGQLLWQTIPFEWSGWELTYLTYLGSNIEETVMNKVTPERIVFPPVLFTKINFHCHGAMWRMSPRLREGHPPNGSCGDSGKGEIWALPGSCAVLGLLELSGAGVCRHPDCPVGATSGHHVATLSAWQAFCSPGPI